jgi:hypothetical protein
MAPSIETNRLTKAFASILAVDHLNLGGFVNALSPVDLQGCNEYPKKVRTEIFRSFFGICFLRV